MYNITFIKQIQNKTEIILLYSNNITSDYIYSNQILCTFQKTILDCINTCKNQYTCKLQCFKNETSYIDLIIKTCFQLYNSNNNCNNFQNLNNNLKKCDMKNFNNANWCFNDILKCPDNKNTLQKNPDDIILGCTILGVIIIVSICYYTNCCSCLVNKYQIHDEKYKNDICV